MAGGAITANERRIMPGPVGAMRRIGTTPAGSDLGRSMPTRYPWNSVLSEPGTRRVPVRSWLTQPCRGDDQWRRWMLQV